MQSIFYVYYHNLSLYLLGEINYNNIIFNIIYIIKNLKNINLLF